MNAEQVFDLDAQEILFRLARMGVSVAWDGSDLVLEGPDEALDRAAKLAREAKVAMVALLIVHEARLGRYRQDLARMKEVRPGVWEMPGETISID